jgi:hypothetical protein
MQEVSLFMSGAHGDIEAVFDYAPDAKLLADAAAQDAAYDEDSRDGMGLSSSISLAAGTGGVGGVGGVGGHRVSGWYNVRRMSEYQDTAVAEEPEESDIEEEDEDQVAAAEETEGTGGDKHSVASSQAGNGHINVDASTPTPKPLGIPQLHPETIATEGILSTSPGQHVRKRSVSLFRRGSTPVGETQSLRSSDPKSGDRRRTARAGEAHCRRYTPEDRRTGEGHFQGRGKSIRSSSNPRSSPHGRELCWRR